MSASEPAYKRIEVQRLNGRIGAEISGVDLSNPLDDETFAEIKAALAENEVIVFRGQDAMDIEDQKAFGSRFGELSIHPFSPNKPDNPEVIILDNNADNPPALTDSWHADETFRDAPPFATILRSRIVPDHGGDTMFSSMTAAYDGLSDRMKAYVEGLVAEHDFKPWRPLFGSDPASKKRLRELEDEFPRPLHPIVREHPVTGKKALYVNPSFTVRIIGLPADESENLLKFLYSRAHIPENQLRVKWQPNTLVMWDNYSLQHYAVHDYWPQHRSMERVTVKGEKPFGPIDESLLPAGQVKDAFGTADTSNKNVAVRQFERT